MTRLFAALALIPLPALAETAAPAPETPLIMTYAQFEQAVPHIDLPVCPVEVNRPGRFCRLTVINDGLNVFVFSEEGDQPLIDLRTWPSDLLAGLMD